MQNPKFDLYLVRFDQKHLDLLKFWVPSDFDEYSVRYDRKRRNRPSRRKNGGDLNFQEISIPSDLDEYFVRYDPNKTKWSLEKKVCK